MRSVQYYLSMSTEEKDAFEKRFGVRLQNCYGSTESVCWVLTDLPYGVASGLPWGVRAWATRSISWTRRAHACRPGEIRRDRGGGIMGETLMKGYYSDLRQRRTVMTRRGALRTGDKGYRDEAAGSTSSTAKAT